MKKGIKALIIILVILALLAAGVFFGGNYLSQQTAKKISNSAERYTVTKGELSLYAVGSGKITSADAWTVALPGTLVELKVRVGDVVKKGDVLARYQTVLGEEKNFTSDYAGVVSVVPGASLTGASASFEISGQEHLQMDIQATEKDVYKIKNDQTASIYIDALNLTVNGKVSRISRFGVTAGDYSVYTVTVSFDKGEANIYLGMTGSAKITVESKGDVLKIPTEALIESGGKRYVLKSEWLDHIAQPQSDYYIEITTGLADSEYIEILSGEVENQEILILAEETTPTWMTR